MRRILAAVLLFVLNAAWVAPPVLAQTASPLPPCCRKAGKHKCAMGHAGAQGFGSSLHTVAERCPFSEQRVSLSNAPPSAVAPSALRISGFRFVDGADFLPAEVFLRFAPSLARSQRGPPVFSI